MLTKEKIDELKAKHGNIRVIRHSKFKDAVAVVRIPDMDDYQMYRDHVHESERRSTAMVALVNECIVWPEDGERTALFNKYPAFYETVGNKLIAEAGADEAATVEKP